MTITKTKNGNAVTLTLDGSLDALTAPELQKELEAIDENTESLVIDMEKLQYISSAGIRQLVAICKRMNGQLVIKNTSGELMDIFHVTGIDRIIRFE
jgi:anti-sigma B factor antagonist